MANKIENARDHNCESLINQSLYVFPMSSFAVVVSRVSPITSSLSVEKTERERGIGMEEGREEERKRKVSDTSRYRKKIQINVRKS